LIVIASKTADYALVRSNKSQFHPIIPFDAIGFVVHAHAGTQVHLVTGGGFTNKKKPRHACHGYSVLFPQLTMPPGCCAGEDCIIERTVSSVQEHCQSQLGYSGDSLKFHKALVRPGRESGQ
jgi:hypothetical protein